MSKEKQWSRWLATGLALAVLGAAFGCNGPPPPDPRPLGASVLTLRLPVGMGRLKRPAVVFPHAKHRKALAKKGCKACHKPGKGGKIAFDLGRSGGKTSRTLLRGRYHDLCVGCHRKSQHVAVTGKPRRRPPVACAECHVPGGRAPKTTRVAMRLDYSLHARHVKTLGSKQCKTCHHAYDKKRKVLVYRKGKEGACSDCHGPRDQGRTPSLRHASHQSCVGCHQRRAEGKQTTGPQTCVGCHDAAKQRRLKRLSPIPRLKTSQKDMVAIHTAGVKAAPVPFNHKLHEGATRFCTSCHHKTVKACGKCHQRLASKKGGGISLETASHSRRSEHSCVGCHTRTAAQKDCAGCHRFIGDTPRKRACTTCHSRRLKPVPIGARAAPTSRRSGTIGTLAIALPPRPKLAPLPPTSAAFPDKVVIKLLARNYKPSILPHRKIVARLHKIVSRSKLATRFHGSTAALCAGCHHRGKPGGRPAPCKSCHSLRGHATRDKPGLKAAYHRQCMGCHRSMGIRKLGCTDCHAKARGGKR